MKFPTVTLSVLVVWQGDTAVSDEEDDEGAVEEEEEEEEEEEFAPHPDCQSTILFTNRHTEGEDQLTSCHK